MLASLRMFVRRLLSRVGRDRSDAGLDDELRFHLEMETERHRARGLSPAEARREARRGLGGLDRTKERYRDQRGLPALETLLQDVRFGIRLLVRHRGFTAVAVLTLALGIGANTAIFSVVNGVLLEPLPYDGADRIVTVWEDFSAVGGPAQEWIEVPNFFEWKAETDLFETMVAFGGRAANLTGRGEARQLTEIVVSHDFFETFALTPALGRDLGPDDDQPGAPRVVLLSHGLWQRDFAGDPAVLGQTLTLDGQPVTIVGVAPEGFAFPGAPPADLWGPLQLDASSARRGAFFLQGLARLQPDVTVEQAEDRLDAMMARIGDEFPEDRGVTMRLVPLLDQLVTPVRAGLYVLLGIVGFVLLIACANIANLMLSRSAVRARELAVRAAMGAGRRRLVRQLLTESVVLSLTGAVLGVLLAGWGTRALLAAIPAAAAPRLDNVAIDGRVLLFTLAVAMGAGLLFGLAPVAQLSRQDVGGTLKDGGRSVHGGRHGARLRGTLAAGQIALALCLLIAAGLTMRSFTALLDVDPGFRPDGVVTAAVTMPPSEFAGAPELVVFLDDLVTRVEARSGVEAVGAVSVLPLAGDGDSDTSFEIEGRPELNVPGRQPTVWYRRVTPSYFRAMGVRVVRGREFTIGDRADAPRVVLVSEATAERFWPGEDALGKRVRFGDGEWHTIVGITQGVRYVGLDQPPRPELYFPFAQRPGRAMTVVVRSSADEAALADLLRADLAEVSPNTPLSSVASMSSLRTASLAQARFVMGLTAAFGALALILAAVGVYGVMSYTVTSRTTELGVRMALGAGRGSVLAAVVGHGVRLTAIGLGVGLALAWWASASVANLLFEIDPQDVATFAGAPLVLAAVALSACLLPALRATRIDPIRALRVE